MQRDNVLAVAIILICSCSAYSRASDVAHVSSNIRLTHNRRLLQPVQVVQVVAQTPTASSSPLLPPLAAAPQQGNPSNAAVSPGMSNDTSVAPGPSPGSISSQRLPVNPTVSGGSVADLDLVNASPPPLPEGGLSGEAAAPASLPAAGALPVPVPGTQSQQGSHMSVAVIVVIALVASLAVVAGVASAIQLARRRRQRRALLVRDTIHKDSMRAPVLELGAGRSDSAEQTWSSDKAVVPIVQTYKKSVYVPGFVMKHLLRGSKTQVPSGASQNANDSQALVQKSGHVASLELQPVHGREGEMDDMEVDQPHSSSRNTSEAEEWQDVDIGDPMDYESSEPTTSAESRDRDVSQGSTKDSARSGSQRRTLRSRYSSQMLPLTPNNRWDSAGSAELASPGGSGRTSLGSSAALQGCEIDPSDIEILKREDGSEWLLGEGAFGKVYKALRGGTTVVAVKIVTAGTHVELTEFKNEADVLAGCRDAHIVQFFGACFQPMTMLVTEYMPGGNLRSRLSSYEDGDLYLWRNRGRKLVLDVAAGLVFLHSRRIVHFDLKAANVLLSEDGCSAKIADVGMASVLSNAEYVTSVGNSGTFAWAAPELLMGKKCSSKADMYSFGVLLFEVVTGELPKRGCLRDIRIPEEACKGVEVLLNLCLEADPKKRPSARQAFDVLKSMPP